MLIAFMALVNFVNLPLGWLGEWMELEGGLSLARLFGWVFAPVAWLMRDSSLANESRTARYVLAAYLASSALLRSVWMTGALIPE